LPTEGKDIKVGMRVRSTTLDQENRTGEVSDWAFTLI